MSKKPLFKNSKVMQEFEKIADEKGWIKSDVLSAIEHDELKIKKQDLSPAENFDVNLITLCQALREEGLDDQAEELEKNYLDYKVQEDLYKVHGEKAEALIHQAHDGDDKKITDTQENLGTFRDDLEKQKVMLDVAKKSAIGKFAEKKSSKSDKIVNLVKSALNADQKKNLNKEAQWYKDFFGAKTDVAKGLQAIFDLKDSAEIEKTIQAFKISAYEKVKSLPKDQQAKYLQQVREQITGVSRSFRNRLMDAAKSGVRTSTLDAERLKILNMLNKEFAGETAQVASKVVKTPGLGAELAEDAAKATQLISKTGRFASIAPALKLLGIGVWTAQSMYTMFSTFIEAYNNKYGPLADTTKTLADLLANFKKNILQKSLTDNAKIETWTNTTINGLKTLLVVGNELSNIDFNNILRLQNLQSLLNAFNKIDEFEKAAWNASRYLTSLYDYLSSGIFTNILDVIGTGIGEKTNLGYLAETIEDFNEKLLVENSAVAKLHSDLSSVITSLQEKANTGVQQKIAPRVNLLNTIVKEYSSLITQLSEEDKEEYSKYINDQIKGLTDLKNYKLDPQKLDEQLNQIDHILSDHEKNIKEIKHDLGNA